jgi:hypothetical protein
VAASRRMEDPGSTSAEYRINLKSMFCRYDVGRKNIRCEAGCSVMRDYLLLRTKNEVYCGSHGSRDSNSWTEHRISTCIYGNIEFMSLQFSSCHLYGSDSYECTNEET